MGYRGVPGKAGANALMLVEGYGHSVAGAADGDTLFYFSFLYGICQGVSEIGVVTGLCGSGAEIYHLVPFALKVCDKLLFVFHACVVVADAYGHSSSFML